uniref:RNase H type-1 domain-containing protein n=1 Tax=Brassica oleracea var. oleracea TaxID=109376 RepID=A0A0D3BH80_BRAOL
MECMKTLDFSYVVFAKDCSQLVKMVSSPGEWPAFATHMEEFQRSKSFFHSFKIQYIPRATNLVADKLA